MVCCPVAQQVRTLSLAAKPPRHSKDGAVRFHFMHFHALRLLKLTRVHWRPAFLECFGLGRAGCALSILEVLQWTVGQQLSKSVKQRISSKVSKSKGICTISLDYFQSVGLFRFLFCLLGLFRFDCFFCLFRLEAFRDDNLRNFLILGQ